MYSQFLPAVGGESEGEDEDLEDEDNLDEEAWDNGDRGGDWDG